MVVLVVLNTKNTTAPPFQLLVIQSRLSFFFETLDTHPYLRLYGRFEQFQTDFLRSASFSPFLKPRYVSIPKQEFRQNY